MESSEKVAPLGISLDAPREKEGVYSDVLVKITDGTALPGDILVYASSPEELEVQRKKFGKSGVGRVVIVVGSHGWEAMMPGGRTGPVIDDCWRDGGALDTGPSVKGCLPHQGDHNVQPDPDKGWK
ncbi:hypothetical protein [Candidatus Manganitrophus noduliformans]|uniref:Uncharacterized protein n=1 Tax=Candidatus Manganitrophus noduliformans TaxID=2606439 RepID=A0A7X6IDY9_9BACT|nr:hypothetical protein [Candidatus Manganitrophus noduliformans]NKE73750.1 hypothetical protein [Candidatus Manganitrophus noduliformans]